MDTARKNVSQEKFTVHPELGHRFEWTKTLSPNCFAAVMATGIVSIAGQMIGFKLFADVLLWINVAVYAVLVCASIYRAFRYTHQVSEDLQSHRNGFGIFAAVSATCILGMQFLLNNAYEAATVLLVLGAWLWVASIYSILLGLIVKHDKPELEHSINGTWLLATVATESVALLACMLSEQFDGAQTFVLFSSTALWLFGGTLYAWMMSIILYRYLFLPMNSSDIEPPHWIDMGAMAIASLCGCELIKHLGSAPALLSLMPFVQGTTLLFWAVATWWLPMSALLTAWHWKTGGLPRYNSALWSAVFPLGVYAVATGTYANVLSESFLVPVAITMAGVSLAAWGFVLSMFIRSRFHHAP